MDEATEPLIAVIGHPIAGHPAQFALEKAFAHLGLDYRVASFDVSPENLGKALDGIDVLRFRGAYLDGSIRAAATTWTEANSGSETQSIPQVSNGNGPDANMSDKPSECEDHRLPTEDANRDVDDNVFSWLSQSFDCLARSGQADLPLCPSGQARQALVQRIQTYFQDRQRPLQTVLVLGQRSARSDFPPSPSRLEAADLIVIPDINLDILPPASGTARSRATRNTGVQPRALAFDQWPEGERLVIDLRTPTDSLSDETEQLTLLDRGYTVIDSKQQLIGGLVGCIRQWTDLEIADEIIADAIEEYTAV